MRARDDGRRSTGSGPSAADPPENSPLAVDGRRPVVDRPPSPVATPTAHACEVRVLDLHYAVRGREILKGIDLQVEPGEIISIMGVSGGGKTTLLKCIGGLIRPTSGQIFIGEAEIAHLNESALNGVRRRLGMVFQYAALFDSLTVFENVGFGLRYQGERDEEKIRAVVEEKLAAVGMEGTERLYPAELSGGMRKRVGLARALATDPDLLLYDEPTSGLDPVVATIIDELIVSVRDRLGVTSIVVSHHIPSIFKISDRVAMLNEGRLAAVGTVAEIRDSQDPVVRQFVEGRAEGPIHVMG
jgi:phospholipid/cholesterol/gamma-HCH transport system ATP-binding protein